MSAPNKDNPPTPQPAAKIYDILDDDDGPEEFQPTAWVGQPEDDEDVVQRYYSKKHPRG